MDRYIVVLANSKKLKGRCLAGIELSDPAKQDVVRGEDGTPRWIRPVRSDDPKQGLDEKEVGSFNFGDIIKISDAEETPAYAHSENVKYSRLSLTGMRFNGSLLDLAEHIGPDGIFGGTGDRISPEEFKKERQSLVLVNAKHVEFYEKLFKGEPRFRARFLCNGDVYDFRVTDLAFLEVLKSRRAKKETLWNSSASYFLTISLGEEFSEQGNAHFKLVANVMEQNIDEQLSEKLRKYREISQKMKELESEDKACRLDILNLMKENNREKFRSEHETISYFPARKIMQFDQKLLKKELPDLYNHYQKETIKKEYISITAKKNPSQPK